MDINQGLTWVVSNKFTLTDDSISGLQEATFPTIFLGLFLVLVSIFSIGIILHNKQERSVLTLFSLVITFIIGGCFIGFPVNDIIHNKLSATVNGTIVRDSKYVSFFDEHKDQFVEDVKNPTIFVATTDIVLSEREMRSAEFFNDSPIRVIPRGSFCKINKYKYGSDLESKNVDVLAHSTVCSGKLSWLK